MLNKFIKNRYVIGCLLLVALSQTIDAQNLTGPTTVEPNSSVFYSYYDGLPYPLTFWEATGGTIFTDPEYIPPSIFYSTGVVWGAAGTGTIKIKKKFGILIEALTVTIQAAAPPPPTLDVSDENYVYSISPRIATTDALSLSEDDKIETITYFDGLGRPMQSIAKQAGGEKQDVITPVVYDSYGRQTQDYLPFADPSQSGNPSLLYQDPVALLSSLETYYVNKYDDDKITSTTINAYSEKELENSPLNRVLKQAAPGQDWKLGNGNEIEFDYQTNVANEVKVFNVNLSFANNTYTPTLTGGTLFYTANELYKTITRDENHSGTTSKNHTTEEFKNKNGQVVLKRTYNNGISHDTFYVYDDFGNLTYVLPPKAEPNAGLPSGTVLDELCYQYKYDHRNRLVEKKIPGKGWEYIVYNRLDQPAMTQDANLKAQDKWLFTKYDAFGRVAYTGLKNSTGSRSSFQNSVDNTNWYNEFVQKTSSYITVDGTKIYYTNDAIPTTMDEIHTINYYDDYIFDIGSGVSEDAYGVTPTDDTKGLATGSKVKVLTTGNWITTVSYYDYKARPIYVYSNNAYLGTTDKIKSELNDFTGEELKTQASHTKNSITITNEDSYTYDHMGRLKKQTQTITGNSTIQVLAENDYDELGQLVSKGVGGKTTQSRLQNVNYTYNIRGWLKQINDVTNLGTDLFTFKLNYNTKEIGSTNTGLYNGNISETIWKTANDGASGYTRAYAYKYDDLNRITYADYGQKTTGSYNLGSGFDIEVSNYDKNGNITSMWRNNSSGRIDQLTYNYHNNEVSNKLKRVNDTSGTDGFKNGASLTEEYTYDVNGNMIKDLNKGIEGASGADGIVYNHLNLPTEVRFGSTNKIQYIYDATGVKLEKKVIESGNPDVFTYYTGNYVYENSSLKFSNHSEGYLEPKDPTNYSLGFNYIYQYKDHLGNVRLSYKNDDAVASVNIDDDFNSSTDGWSSNGSTTISNNSQKLNISITNKWNSSGKYIAITPGQPLHIEFYFERGSMQYPTFYVKENINGAWESNENRDAIYNIQDGYHIMDLTLTGQGVMVYFEKSTSTDDGTSTNCYVDNFKVTQNGLEILEENNYYPFGLKHKGYNTNVTSTNIALKKKFGGKEYQDELGLDWYDVSARNYDPALGRWMNLDPLTELMYTQSPYNYGFNNPIYFIDLDGLSPSGPQHITGYYDDGAGNIVFDPNVNNQDDLDALGIDGATYVGDVYYDESSGTLWDENGNPHENVVFDFLKMDYKFSWSFWFKNLTGTTNVEYIGSGFVITGKGNTTKSNNRSEHPEDDVYIPQEVFTALTSVGKTAKGPKAKNVVKAFQNGTKDYKEIIRIKEELSKNSGTITENIPITNYIYNLDTRTIDSTTTTMKVTGSKSENKRRADSAKQKVERRRRDSKTFFN